MSALILDAGALIAIERGDRATTQRLRVADRDGDDLRTNAMVVAQVWRDPRGRQARLARFLRDVDVRAVDETTGRAAGMLLARAGAADAIDATVVLLAEDGDRILTSDVADLERLVAASGVAVVLVAC